MNCRLLLISGSLRAASTNSAVLRTAAAVAPEGVTAVLYDGIAGLPHFNPDDDAGTLDARVAELRAQFHAADALLFCTPEYAGALPGSFKNVLDWSIGDDEPGSIYGKPAAWVNASPRGAHGAHHELRSVLAYAKAAVVDRACVEIPVTSVAIGPDGVVSDPATRDRIADAVAALVEHAGCRASRDMATGPFEAGQPALLPQSRAVPPSPRNDAAAATCALRGRTS
jgi:chromate reductase, NAD(P)H dehydrogenase (quinone)